MKLWHPESRAYYVEDSVSNHTAVGLGAYPINPCWGEEARWNPVPHTNTLFQFPAGADLKLVMGWNNGCVNQAWSQKPKMVNTYVNVLTKGGQKYGEDGNECDSAHTYGVLQGYCYIATP